MQECRRGMAEVELSQQLDVDLVRRVQRGDSAAFDLLVRKYQHRIVALIGRYISDWSE
jgi:RNA polymerase sigma-70 factor (ECF subfamily)